MKYIFTIAFSCTLIFTKAQTNTPKLEASFSPGLFLEQLSNDSLVPPGRRNVNRLGDVSSFALEFALPLKNKRFTIKTGAGFSKRHYSINKYAVFPIYFLPRPDSFTIDRVKFSNNYFQIPVSASYTVTRPIHNFQLAIGLSIRSDFLTKSNAAITFDSTYKIPSSTDIALATKMYTEHATKYVITAEPYAEASFSIQQQWGLFFQCKPVSFYSTKLNERLTTSTVGLFSFTFGIFYSLK